jgi:serine/threonine protein kinase
MARSRKIEPKPIPGADLLASMRAEPQSLLLNPRKTFEPQLFQMLKTYKKGLEGIDKMEVDGEVQHDDEEVKKKESHDVTIGKDAQGKLVTISKCMGYGNCGYVFYGLWKETNVVIKRIKINEKKPLRACLEVEILRALTQRNAPNVLTYYFSNTLLTNCFYVGMEAMNLGSLIDYINLYESDWTLRTFIIAEVARAIEFMHSVKILHNDIKAANVLLSEKEGKLKVKVGDFGLSEFISDSTDKESFWGSPFWMAPELLLQTTFNSCATDMYSFGNFVWEVADWKGDHPYSHLETELEELSDLVAVVTELKNEEIPQPIPEDTPANIKEVMIGCWNMDYSQMRMKAFQVLPTLFKPCAQTQPVMEQSTIENQDEAQSPSCFKC